MKQLWRIAPIGLLLLVPACARLQVAPIEVKPIHIIHDINIRVDKQLDDFFAFQEQKASTQAAATQPAATQPAATQAADAKQ